MPPKPAFVSLLWRREGTTPKKFADYYESSYLPLISTLVTLPLIHERSYPIDSNAITLTNRPSEGILSFDSVTAMVFDAQADFEVARNSLARRVQTQTSGCRRRSFYPEGATGDIL